MKNLYKIEDELYIISDTENINESDYIITTDNRLVQVSYLLSKDLEGASKVILTTNKLLIKDGIQAIDDEFLEWFVKNPSCEEIEVISERRNWKEINWITIYKIIIPKEEPTLANMRCGCIRFEANCFTGNCRICGFPPKEEPKSNLERLPFPELVKEFTEYYKNIPLTEKPKQETLEEAAEKWYDSTEENKGFPKMKAFIEGAKWQAERSYSEEEVYNIIQQLRLQLKTGVLKWQDDFEFDLSEWFEQFSKLKNG